MMPKSAVVTARMFFMFEVVFCVLTSRWMGLSRRINGGEGICMYTHFKYIYIFNISILYIHYRNLLIYYICFSPPPLPPPSPPPPLPLLPCTLPPCQLFAKLFANFHTQWALQDLNCKGLSALGTAGPQPGTFRAQWAPLDLNLGPSELSEHRDLNLGPSELSEHRWTSTAR